MCNVRPRIFEVAEDVLINTLKESAFHFPLDLSNCYFLDWEISKISRSTLHLQQQSLLETRGLFYRHYVSCSTFTSPSFAIRPTKPMSHPPLKILISGSGIAGSVFAYWVLRAHPKATITIVERDGSLRLTGASVDIRNAAVDIIKWMGCEEAIRAQATHEEGMQIVNLQGAPIATFKATGREDIQSLTSEFEIFRGELASIFLDRVEIVAKDKVKFIFNESIDHFEQDGNGVRVTFTKSKEVAKYDLLVAADGVGSKIRGLMLGTKSQEQIVDKGIYLAFFTIRKDLLGGGKMAKGLNFPGGRACFLRPDTDAKGRTRAMFMIVTPTGESEVREKLKLALNKGGGHCMELLESMFEGAGWLVPEVLKGMRESDDFYITSFGQIRSPKLQAGRVVLLGDAGYATAGMGTSLAIIGGYILAGELLNGNVKEALEAYERIMLPFVKSQQGGGGGDWAIRCMMPQSQWGVDVRNAVLSWVSWARLDQAGLWVASKLGLTEKKVEMPDYQWPTA